MKYQYRVMSDLHLNHQSEYWVPPTFDNDKDETILILAGDCVDGAAHDNKFIAWLETVSSMFYAIVLVWGNHDYYRENLDTMNGSVLDKTSNISNLHILNNNSVVFGSDVIIGATLWTDFNNQDPLIMIYSTLIMNDYRYIKTGDDHSRLLPQRILEEHNKSLEYIKNNLEEVKQGNQDVIVVTHHHPTFQTNQGGRYNCKDTVPLYHSNLDTLIEKYQPDIWVCGHTHQNGSVMIGNTLVVSNCRGYTSEQAETFNDMLTLRT